MWVLLCVTNSDPAAWWCMNSDCAWINSDICEKKDQEIKAERPRSMWPGHAGGFTDLFDTDQDNMLCRIWLNSIHLILPTPPFIVWSFRLCGWSFSCFSCCDHEIITCQREVLLLNFFLQQSAGNSWTDSTLLWQRWPLRRAGRCPTHKPSWPPSFIHSCSARD